MAIFTKELLHLNRKMKIVLLVIAAISLVTLFFLWRYMVYKSMGENGAYKAPINVFADAEKLMIRGKFDRAIKRYEEAERMLCQIPNIDLSNDFYYARVNNEIGAIYLRIGIYGKSDDDNAIKSRAELPKDRELLKKSQVYFDVSINAYQKWLDEHRPSSEKIAALYKSREGVAEDKIELEPFERYERALSISWANRGMALRYLGDIAGATAAYNKALELWGDNETARANLKSMREVIAEEKSKAEEKMLDR